MDEIEKFSAIIRKRSSEHSEAMHRVEDLPGMMVSILRQELDSMVRTIFLLSIDDLDERKRLITQSLNGEVWSVKTEKGKNKKVTDREMVELSNKLQGWTLSVYKFGCAFIHFSNFHDYSARNPFESLDEVKQKDILEHLRYYHGGPATDRPNFGELSSYFPRVFNKISDNLECYLEELESNDVQHVA
jgi:predicted AlkP superfamily pyrophosphatase or phosphodiesterase